MLILWLVLWSRWPRQLDVIVRVAIIWNKGAAVVIACQFDLVRVDTINVDHMCGAVKLNDCLSGAYSRCSELWINVRVVSAHVPANMVQFNAMSALWPGRCVIVYFRLDSSLLLLLSRWCRS